MSRLKHLNKHCKDKLKRYQRIADTIAKNAKQQLIIKQIIPQQMSTIRIKNSLRTTMKVFKKI